MDNKTKQEFTEGVKHFKNKKSFAICILSEGLSIIMFFYYLFKENTFYPELLMLAGLLFLCIIFYSFKIQRLGKNAIEMPEKETEDLIYREMDPQIKEQNRKKGVFRLTENDAFGYYNEEE